MTCDRCGGEAVVKRENAVYCGKCALARDWEEIINIVQLSKVSMGDSPPRPPQPTNGSGPDGSAEAVPGVQAAEAAPEPEPEAPVNLGPPADPFAA